MKQFILLACVVALFGCEPRQVAPSAPPGSATDRGDGAAPVIVTLAPHLAELVFTAGAGAQLAGVVAHSDYPAAVLELPSVGDAFRVDLERLASMSPDVVLAWDSGNPDAMIAQLRRRGYRVEVITTDTLDQVAAAIERIGTIAGTGETAATAARDYRQSLQTLRQRYAGSEPVLVFYQVARQPLYTIGARHPITEIITVCGGSNIFADIGQVAPVVAVEDVLLRQPQVIIAGEPPGEVLLEDWRQWPQLPAVANAQLYTVNASLVARSSVRILDGLRAICSYLEHAR